MKKRSKKKKNNDRTAAKDDILKVKLLLEDERPDMVVFEEKQMERYEKSNNFTEVYCNYNKKNRVVPTKEVLSRTLDRAMEQNKLLASINADVLARGKRPAVVQSSIKPFAASAGKGLRTAKVHGAYTDAADE